MKQTYFLTVDWCNKSRRGIFCDVDGHCFRKDDEPHTALEMQTILDVFWIILSPKSELLTEEQVAEFTFWLPLAEYSNQFGVAHNRNDSEQCVSEMQSDD